MTKEQPVVDAHQGKQLSSCLVHPQLTGENNFRLLRVMPAQENGSSIHCKLFPASFTAQAQKYIAGSYVWGPPQPTLPIFVNGCIVHVRENLAHFLRACRTRFSYRTLWIDALCINQDDIAERNSQVRAMSKIYLNAKSLYCWLGQDEKMSRSLHTCIKAHKQKAMYSDHTDMDDEVSTSIQMIAKSKYFTRMWIVQEFLLGEKKNFLAGTQKIPYSHLEELLGLGITPNDAEETWSHTASSESDGVGSARFREFLRKRRAETQIVRAASKDKPGQEVQLRMGWSRIRDSKSLGWSQLHDFSKRRRSWSLEDLFEGFGTMSCSVPQDKVFALLGLLEVRTGQELVMALVDYNLSIWQLLYRILCPVTYPTYPTRKTNFEGVQAFTFTYTYAHHVIKDAEDEHMKACTDFEFTGGPLILDSHLSCYCIDPWAPDSFPHVCLQRHSAFPTPKQGHFAFPMKQHVAMFQYSPHVCPYPSYNLVDLPSMKRPSQHGVGSTGALIECCSGDCYHRDQWDGSAKLVCKGHSIAGFIIKPRKPASFDRVSWFKDSKAHTADEIASPKTSHDPPLFHKSLLSQMLPKALSEFANIVRVFALENLRYRLVISLEMLVRLTSILRELENAFEVEIEPYRDDIRYTYYYDEKEVV